MANAAQVTSKITDRIDAITKIPDDIYKTVLPVPRSVKIELTARCDLACFFCASKMKLRPKKDMEWELFTRLLKEMRLAGVDEIGLFYLGESFLYQRLEEAIRYAKKECKYPYVFLTTNGRTATKKRVYECARAGLDSLKFSFNNADRAQFKDVTGVDSYDEVVRNLRDARAAVEQVAMETGHRCGLYASSILYDGEQKDRMDDSIRPLLPLLDEHYFLPLYNQAGFTAGSRGTKAVAGNVGRVGALRAPLPCWAVFTAGHITYDGYLSACCFDHDGRFNMGDLKEMPFTEAWNSQAFQELRRSHLKKDVRGTACEACIIYQE
ncbi:MAG: radical SAM protein [Candidatus Omnitrophota bacterium]|nr:radical SAM protein [Candidatus Omnitrophota bacterium]